MRTSEDIYLELRIKYDELVYQKSFLKMVITVGFLLIPSLSFLVIWIFHSMKLIHYNFIPITITVLVLSVSAISVISSIYTIKKIKQTIISLNKELDNIK